MKTLRRYAAEISLTARLAWNKVKEKVPMWIAWHLPRRVVMWSYVRVAAHATTGKYGNTNPTNLGMMEALKRWDDR